MTELQPGTPVTATIRLLRRLGAGGMGSVWVAEHLSLRTHVVVKFGPAGCQVGSRRIVAPAVEVVDSTGAGDAFAAAFCASILHRATPVEAAERAVAVAAEAVGHAGARPVPK